MIEKECKTLLKSREITENELEEKTNKIRTQAYRIKFLESENLKYYQASTFDISLDWLLYLNSFI